MDSYVKFEQEIDSFWSGQGESNTRMFWGADGIPVPNYALLEKLLTRSLQDGDSTQSGGLAKGLDMWLAEELRAAGFDDDAVWPRVHEPRVLDPEIGRFVAALPKDLKQACEQKLGRGGSATANVQGAVYEKQIDVGMSSWLTGPEILISTKTMSGSFGKNLANRFEEAYGDAMNLRKRYPLAAIGFFFLVNESIAQNAAELSKAITMLRKLQEDGVYTASALLLVDLSDGRAVVAQQTKHVPGELSVPTFLGKIVEVAILHGSVRSHQTVREKAHAVDVML